MFKEFKEFALKGSVLDLAIGMIIGSIFGKIVDSLVNDMIMPPLGLLIGNVDFSNLFINLSDKNYASLAEAEAAGAPTINYGVFINVVISFVIIAFVVFLFVRQINKMRRKDEPKDNIRTCPFCITTIDDKATRCPSCTSQLAAVG